MSPETQAVPLTRELPPPKFTRYRSVRRAKGIDSTSSSTAPAQTKSPTQDVFLTRLPSRYHRKVRSVNNIAEMVGGQDNNPADPLRSRSAALAALTGESYSGSTPQHTQKSPSKTATEHDAMSSVSAQIKSIPRLAARPNPSPAAAFENLQRLQSGSAVDHISSTVRTSNDEINEHAGERLGDKDEQRRRLKVKQNAAREFERSKRITATGATRQEDLSLYKKRDSGNVATATSQCRSPIAMPIEGKSTQNPASRIEEVVSSPSSRDSPSARNDVNGFRHGQNLAHHKAEALPPAVRSLSLHRKFSHPLQTKSPRPSQHYNAPSETLPVRASMPLSKSTEQDAVTCSIPRSAVNAGERRVVIKYRESVLSLPVTPTTTPYDLLKYASTSMSNPFDPQQSVLLESFTQLGLERSLRRYEHVRNVMNSWDHDTQNNLIVAATSANALSKSDLDPRLLPKQPAGTSLYMYHSQRPGRWDKRWVSLKQDGQMSISKREDGSESFNICHLSDFDIYKPTQRQMKKLRPPKNICFAIKSQQKSAMFLNGANFVHFFATTDGPSTETWCSAIRTWRSWYLVTVLGEGQEQGSSENLGEASAPVPRTAVSGTKGQNQLLSLKRGQQARPGLSKAVSPTKVAPRPPPPDATGSRDLCEFSSRGRCAPPSSFPNYHSQQPDAIVPSPNSKRAPLLIGGGERTASMRSNAEAPASLRRSTSLPRARSICPGPKPLVACTWE